MSGTDRVSRRQPLVWFEAKLDQFGSRIASWPQAEQAEAWRLLEAEPQATAALRTAERIEAALAVLVTPEPSAASSVAFVDGTVRFGKAGPAVRDGGTTRVNVRRLAAWGSAVLAASLMIGFVAGASMSAPDEDDGAAYTMLDADSGNIL